MNATDFWAHMYTTAQLGYAETASAPQYPCDTSADTAKNLLDLHRSRNAEWKQDTDPVFDKKEN